MPKTQIDLKQYARNMRFKMTEAEKALWYHLRDRRFCNLRFNRQVVIGNYIVDFLCKELKLVIELDGEQHAEQKIYDEQRTQYLVQQGYKVVRFWNSEVLFKINEVLDCVYLEVERLNRVYKVRLMGWINTPPPSAPPLVNEGREESKNRINYVRII